MPGTASPGNTLGSLDRGLAVLELIARRGEARLAELARELGTSRTTMFRVLETLRARGFAEHVPANHTYRLGPGILSLAAYGTRSAITRLAEPAMADLRNATGETVNLIGVHGSRLVYEAVLEGRYSLRSLPSLGMTVAAHCSALGKAVLAAAPAPAARGTPRTRAVPAIHREHDHRPAPPGYRARRDQTAWIRDRRRRERDRPHLRGRRHPQRRRAAGRSDLGIRPERPHAPAGPRPARQAGSGPLCQHRGSAAGISR